MPRKPVRVMKCYIKNNNSNDNINTMIGGKIFTSIYKTKFLGIIIDENQNFHCL